MIEAGMPPDEPHHGPGVYFIIAVPDRFSIAIPDRVKDRPGAPMSASASLTSRRATRPTCIWRTPFTNPTPTGALAIEAHLHRRFRYLHVLGEWFHWTDELHECVNTLCNEECYLRPTRSNVR
jgi:hypothetical protein